MSCRYKLTPEAVVGWKAEDCWTLLDFVGKGAPGRFDAEILRGNS